MKATIYRGRFAPSPTGPLHFGSLVTALASYLEAKSHGGSWLVRIEDLDPLRESRKAVDQICRSLVAHGLYSDEPIRFQSARHEAYQAIVKRLLNSHAAYRCACSRKQLQAHSGRHPYHCREHEVATLTPQHAIRFALDDQTARWNDDLLGPQIQTVHAELDDPVIQRKEGFYAYQLAVVADDIDQRISHVVRGSDLLAMTAQQQQIYHALGATPPQWLHIPVILNHQGQKLSKQTHAPALDDRQASLNLRQALTTLGQQPPQSLNQSSPTAILAWATEHWRRDGISRHGREGQTR